jgi:hypothetical protein
VTDELKKTHKKGYTIVQIHEVWHFDKMAQYDPDTKTGGVFTDYVDTFLKTKQEASGWPECVARKKINTTTSKNTTRGGVRLDYINRHVVNTMMERGR